MNASKSDSWAWSPGYSAGRSWTQEPRSLAALTGPSRGGRVIIGYIRSRQLLHLACTSSAKRDCVPDDSRVPLPGRGPHRKRAGGSPRLAGMGSTGQTRGSRGLPHSRRMQLDVASCRPTAWQFRVAPARQPGQNLNASESNSARWGCALRVPSMAARVLLARC